MNAEKNIRNFSIIAHIDHGKSTLADRLLELTGTVEKRKMRDQYLDKMELERERGITIKMQPVRMNYTLNAIPYTLNLIDTPGHVDFSYEVSRSLSCVEGAILLVDAVKGVQAQTLANYYLAKKVNLKIIPVINKVDLENAQIKEAEKELSSLTNIPINNILKISAKSGQGTSELLTEIIKQIPPPSTNINMPLRALVFDSFYDKFKGAVAYIRVFEGTIKKGDKIKLIAANAETEILEIGFLKPELQAGAKIQSGEIGYIATGIKDLSKIKIGDTITHATTPNTNPLEGFQEPRSVVFASFYPSSADDFDILRKALLEVKLSDSSIFFEPEQSEALGRGFRCGFLGILHLDIIQERLKREFNLKLIISTPSVNYKIKSLQSGKELSIHSASELSETEKYEIQEPWVKLEILTPPKYLSNIMELATQYRGELGETMLLTENLLILKYNIPLAEIVTDFYDKLKSASSGFASMNYEIGDYKKGNLFKLDILIAEKVIGAFSRILPEEKIYPTGRALVKKLKELIPAQLFPVAIQASTKGRIIARETIKALKKDVTGYLYGGDRTRKMKLWQKQKKGKKKMKELGKGTVDIPSQVFFEILKK